MAEEKLKLHHPWLVAVWPGMGHVALNAGIYLLAKLNMSLITEFTSDELFDVEHVEVKDGIIQLVRRPRNRFFLWRDPKQQHDLIVFVGEAQPPIGKYAFCRRLMTYACELGAERVFTFAAMATQMQPDHPSRVFVAATDQPSLDSVRGPAIKLLEDGQVDGLNGVLLVAANECGLPGTCLLGEMPHIFAQLSFPLASLVILKVFASLINFELDFGELEARAHETAKQLCELLTQAQHAYRDQFPEEEERFPPEPVDEDPNAVADKRRIEELFDAAVRDRSKAFELKQELDRQQVFKDYEDRFLDLFKKQK